MPVIEYKIREGDEPLQNIIKALETLRVPVILEERELHGIIEKTLLDCGIEYEKEYRSGGSRLDFLCESGVALEVKRSKPSRALLLRQLTRYACLSEVNALVLVCEGPVKLPKVLCGKPLVMFALRRLWGVALP